MKSELEACSLFWMGLACLGKGLPLSWKGLGGTDVRLEFVFKGLELATLELDCSDIDLSTSKRGPILYWQGLVCTTMGILFQFQGLLFRSQGFHQPLDGLDSYLPCLALTNKSDIW